MAYSAETAISAARAGKNDNVKCKISNFELRFCILIFKFCIYFVGGTLKYRSRNLAKSPNTGDKLSAANFIPLGLSIFIKIVNRGE
jgi:hypothetical protein